MDEQVKARLIGATVLVVLVVLLVPELLSGPKTGTDDATDAKGKRGTRTYTIDLGAAAGEAARLEPSSAVESTRRPATTTLPTVAPPGVAAEQTTPVATPSPQTTAVAAAPPPTSGARPASGGSSTAEPPSTGTHATRQTPPPAAAKPSPTPKGGWAVQVGAFGSSDAAGKVVADLGRNGYPAYVAPLNRAGKTLYRVRVGPVAAKPEAEKLASRLKASGKSGSVVAAD